MAEKKTVKQSPSEEWRLKGNAKFTGAQAQGINPTLRRDRLNDALNLYYKAYQTAETNDENASAAKNLALSNWKMAPLQSQNGAKTSQVQFYYKEAISYYDKARHFGEKCKDFEWQGKTFDHLMTCFDEAVDQHKHLSYSERIGLNEQYINCLLETPFKAECYITMGLLVFQHGITALQKNDYKTALSCMKECHRPVQEARRLAGSNGDIQTEANVLESDCFTHMCISESLQPRAIGDKLLDEALNAEEVILMSGVFDAMDWYRQAIILTREREVEMEAIANSRLGVIYDKIIKRKDKAHDFFKKAIDLAATLTPKNFAGEDWFQKATEALKRYQDEKLKQETDEWNTNRTKYIVQLEKELKMLKTADLEGTLPYVKHIYSEFPPKNKSHTMGDLDSIDTKSKKSMQNMLKKGLIHYHPDKQKEYGDKWVVLCEEITKILTRRYEYLKCENA